MPIVPANAEVGLVTPATARSSMLYHVVRLDDV